jgi:hypothetical protein
MLLQRAQTGGGDDDIAGFKAGDITVTKRQGTGAKERLAHAEQTRAAAMEDIRPLLKDTGFFAGRTEYTPPAPSAPSAKKGADKRGKKK